MVASLLPTVGVVVIAELARVWSSRDWWDLLTGLMIFGLWAKATLPRGNYETRSAEQAIIGPPPPPPTRPQTPEERDPRRWAAPGPAADVRDAAAIMREPFLSPADQ